MCKIFELKTAISLLIENVLELLILSQKGPCHKGLSKKATLRILFNMKKKDSNSDFFFSPNPIFFHKQDIFLGNSEDLHAPSFLVNTIEHFCRSVRKYSLFDWSYYTRVDYSADILLGFILWELSFYSLFRSSTLDSVSTLE